jgi:response regulator RpfG family c-di-GMP phosphodiesterase
MKTTGKNLDQPPVVLLVDDEKNILSSMKRLLQPAGYRVLAAEHGTEALAILERESIDLVISDMYMPGMNGVELLSRIADRWPDISRVLLTGYSDMKLTIEAVNRGKIYQYVAKPWDNDELTIIVKRAIEYKRSEDQRRHLLELTRRQNEELTQLNATLEQKVAERTQALKQALVLKDKANVALRASYTEAIKVFSNILEARAGVVAGHSRRVAEHAISIARGMKIHDAAVRDIMYAALLHDIGKVGFPDEMLVRPLSAMSGDMKRRVREHPGIAHDILTVMGGLETTALIIRHHHELYDGTGYPDRLSGQTIPAGARIITVADEYDNMVSGGLHAQKLTRQAAIERLVENRGKRYDPQVVDVFVEALAASALQAVRTEQLRDASMLRPGMVLLADIVTRHGVPIMAKGTVLDPQKIHRIQAVEEALAARLEIHVRSSER